MKLQRASSADVGWLAGAASGTIVLTWTGIRAIVDGVQPIDERAYFELRSRDVLTGDHPLLGLGSSAGGSAGDLHHPGPLLFDLLAVPVRLLGGPVGTTVAVVALHALSLWLAVLAVRRVGGPLAAAVSAVGAVVLAWTLGSDLLIDPWQPNVLVLPAYSLCAVTAAAAAGHERWLLVVVALASLCAQTHLGYLLLSAVLVVVAATGAVVSARMAQRPLPIGALSTSLALGVVLWAQPLWQQFFGAGPGNLGRALGRAGDGSATYGPTLATRLVAAVVAVPPAWLRPGYDVDPPQALTRVDNGTLTLDTSRLPSVAVSVTVLLVLVVAAVVLVRLAQRSAVAGVGVLFTVAASATAASFVTLVVMPSDLFGVLVHKYRFLWPVAAFVSTSFAMAAVGILANHRQVAKPLGYALAGLAAVVALANLPARLQTEEEGRFARREIWPVIDELREQVATLELTGPVVFDTERTPFPDYYLVNVTAELDRRDVEVQVTTPVSIGQFGRRRRADGSAITELAVRAGAELTDAPPGSRRVAYVEADRAELSVAVYARPTPEGPG